MCCVPGSRNAYEQGWIVCIAFADRWPASSWEGEYKQGGCSFSRKIKKLSSTISAKKDKPLQSMSQAQLKQQLNDLEQVCDHLQFLKVKGVILVMP